MLCGPSETVEPPNNHAIDTALSGVLYESVECWTTLFGSGVAGIDVFGRVHATGCHVLAKVAELGFGALVRGGHPGVDRCANRCANVWCSHVASCLGDIG